MPTSVCARHADARVAALCAACGDHLCATCEAFGCEEPGCPYRALADGADSFAFPVPWEARTELRWWAAAWHTLRRALTDPIRFFRDLPTDPGGQPLIFGAGAGALGLGVAALALAARRGEADLLLPLILIALPFAMHLRLLVTASICWFLLVMTTGRRAWPTVARVTGYAASVDVLLGVPTVGWVVVPIAAGVYRAVGLRAALGVPRWAALVAALGPTFALGLIVLGVTALAIAGFGVPI